MLTTISFHLKLVMTLLQLSLLNLLLMLPLLVFSLHCYGYKVIDFVLHKHVSGWRVSETLVFKNFFPIGYWGKSSETYVHIKYCIIAVIGSEMITENKI